MKSRLLVVEDNGDHQNILRKFLEPVYEVDIVSHASAGLEKQSRHSYELVLVDFDLGDMTGLDFIRLVRDSGRVYPIVLMSSKMSLELSLNAREAGGTFCAKKEEIFAQKAELLRLIAYLIKKANREIKLRKLVALYAQILEDIQFPMILMEPSGKILLANRKFREILNASSDELIRNKLPRFVEKSHRPELLLFTKQAFTGNETEYFAVHFLNSRNQRVKINLKGRPVFLGKSVPWILLEGQPEPQQISQTQSLHNFLTWLREVHHSLIVVDAAEQLIFWNAEAAHIFQLPEFRGQTLPLDQLLEMESVRKLRRHLSALDSSEAPGTSLKLELQNRMGEQLVLSCRFAGDVPARSYLILRAEKRAEIVESRTPTETVEI